MTAREWVLAIAGGLLIAVLGTTVGSAVVVAGVLIALVGVVGLLWRLTKDR